MPPTGSSRPVGSSCPLSILYVGFIFLPSSLSSMCLGQLQTHPRFHPGARCEEVAPCAGSPPPVPPPHQAPFWSRSSTSLGGPKLRSHLCKRWAHAPLLHQGGARGICPPSCTATGLGSPWGWGNHSFCGKPHFASKTDSLSTNPVVYAWSDIVVTWIYLRSKV